jgi:predicted cupin superfamily sugar epimerase
MSSDSLSGSVAEKLIDHYKLTPHYEGGYFRETYRSTGSSAILYLLANGQKSRLHRLKSDEMWHYYTGNAPLNLVTIENNKLKIIQLGHDIDQNQVVQAVVPAGIWFGAYMESNGYALMGCTVSPAFDIKNYQVISNEEIGNILHQPLEKDISLVKYLMLPPET